MKPFFKIEIINYLIVRLNLLLFIVSNFSIKTQPNAPIMKTSFFLRFFLTIFLLEVFEYKKNVFEILFLGYLSEKVFRKNVFSKKVNG